jgi:D-glycero-alpha-D-manno-heptose-7-phosphate kinase
MPQLVDEAESILTTRQRSVCEFGRFLHESWQIKGTITRKIANSNIDEIYDARPSSDALTGNSRGRAAADLCCLWCRRSGIGRSRLRLKNLRCVPFSFTSKGSHVVVYEPEGPHQQALAQERSLIYA